MAQPNIYNPNNKPDRKPVSLELVYLVSYPALVAVDDRGAYAATLIRFEEYGVYAEDGAEEALKRRGYDTTFANWDKNGCMIVSR